MARLISFASGFLIALICGSLLITGFKPALPYLADLRNTKAIGSVIDSDTVKFIGEQIDGLQQQARSAWDDSIRSFDSLELPQVALDIATTESPSSDENQPDAGRLLLDLAGIAVRYGQEISEVTYSETLGWVANLASGEKLILGEKEFDKRLTRALGTLDALPISEAGIRRIVDARYTMGVAISSEQQLVAMQ